MKARPPWLHARRRPRPGSRWGPRMTSPRSTTSSQRMTSPEQSVSGCACDGRATGTWDRACW
eukprot:1455123-Heterocapsa_arctica.AAC.1